MRQSFHEELDCLHRSVLKMGCLVEEAVKEAVLSIGDPDPNLVEKVILGDDKIDQIYEDVETNCFMILAKQQPVARDLRLIASSLRVISDLERMGDLAINIVKASPGASGGEPLVASDILIRMGRAASVMIENALQAYTKGDVQIAKVVKEQDEKIDDMYLELFERLFDCAGGHELRSAVKSAFVGRYLERIADHCVTIAERVDFMVLGSA
ncbi:MAG: phosphate signaling complex protein PhoU [Actinobacteria bacterium]|nr:phosphate signaling complex protein PhoU [Actinomycetota bacterium]